ncbi:Protein SCAR4 [Clarias magur]|uniref:Protein SCAR4 n=1 Tax=Clarias magur TaxID=1594786 RepID=A0A8J4U4R9_CLAMG|nr:Protein SCAR4 [Clarias magur]
MQGVRTQYEPSKNPYSVVKWNKSLVRGYRKIIGVMKQTGDWSRLTAQVFHPNVLNADRSDEQSRACVSNHTRHCEKSCTARVIDADMPHHALWTRIGGACMR